MHTRTDEDMTGSFMRELRERGLRLTAQREILLRVIAGHLGRTTSVQRSGRGRARGPDIA